MYSLQLLVKKHHDSSCLAANIMLFQSWLALLGAKGLLPLIARYSCVSYWAILKVAFYGKKARWAVPSHASSGMGGSLCAWCQVCGHDPSSPMPRAIQTGILFLSIHRCLDEELATRASANSCMSKQFGKAFLVKSEKRRDVLRVGEEMMTGPSQP